MRYGLALNSVLIIAFVFALVGCVEKPQRAGASPNNTTVDESVDHGAASAASASPQPTAAQQPPSGAAVRPPVDPPTPVEFTDQDWPQFRGARRDGISRETGLLRAWPESGPELMWETPVGEGYAAPAVVAGRVYLNDYDRDANEWMVRCMALEDGTEHWRYAVKKRIRPNHGITRSVPATDGGYVFSIDPKCELHCLDARDGRLVWKVFLPEAFGSQIPPWYNGQCPLITNEGIVIATGGSALLVAFDKATGKILWQTPNEQGYALSHSSVMPAEVDGVKQYVYMTLTGLVGVSAEDGGLLWQFPWKFNVAVPTSPVPIGDGRFFLTSCYEAPTVMCRVRRVDGAWLAEEVFRLPDNGWNSEVHTPILHRGYLFGVGKRRRGLWTCLDLEGNERWTSDRKAAFGLGGYLLADDMFYILEGKTGVLRLVDAEADEYVELASAQLLQGPDVWAPPVLSRGKLLVRDLGRLICLQVAAEPDATAAAATAEASSPTNELR